MFKAFASAFHNDELPMLAALPANGKMAKALTVASFRCPVSKVQIICNDTKNPYSPFKSLVHLQRSNKNTAKLDPQEVKASLSRVGRCTHCEADFYVSSAMADKIAGKQFACTMCSSTVLADAQLEAEAEDLDQLHDGGKPREAIQHHDYDDVLDEQLNRVGVATANTADGITDGTDDGFLEVSEASDLEASAADGEEVDADASGTDTENTGDGLMNQDDTGEENNMGGDDDGEAGDGDDEDATDDEDLSLTDNLGDDQATAADTEESDPAGRRESTEREKDHVDDAPDIALAADDDSDDAGEYDDESDGEGNDDADDVADGDPADEEEEVEAGTESGNLTENYEERQRVHPDDELLDKQLHRVGTEAADSAGDGARQEGETINEGDSETRKHAAKIRKDRTSFANTANVVDPNGVFRVSAFRPLDAKAFAKVRPDLVLAGAGADGREPLWYLMINGQPTATFHYAEASEAVQDFFTDVGRFKEAFAAATAESGINEEVLSSFGMRPIVAALKAKKVYTQALQEAVAAERQKYEQRQAKLLDRMEQCLAMAILGVGKGVFDGKSDMIRTEIIASLEDCQVDEPENMINYIYATHARDQATEIIALANDFMRKSDSTRNELFKFIEKAAFQPVASAKDQAGAALRRRLNGGGGGAEMLTATASDFDDDRFGANTRRSRQNFRDIDVEADEQEQEPVTHFHRRPVHGRARVAAAAAQGDDFALRVQDTMTMLRSRRPI